ncbi:hypothetical protein C2S52_017171 [Perilla frutescens var. hirtella]|nr:hypothetical protein C2S52_017171 [Perilla frutescens var. hirtella]
MPQRRQNNQAQNPPQEDTARVIARFRKYQPLTFNGQGEPTEAKEWLRMMERTFAYMVCTDSQRIACTIFHLTGDADHWWETHRRSITPE